MASHPPSAVSLRVALLIPRPTNECPSAPAGDSREIMANGRANGPFHWSFPARDFPDRHLLSFAFGERAVGYCTLALVRGGPQIGSYRGLSDSILKDGNLRQRLILYFLKYRPSPSFKLSACQTIPKLLEIHWRLIGHICSSCRRDRSV
jgi:hypothetical protein